MSDRPRWLTWLDTRQLGRRRWMLLAPLVYESPLVGRITVPAEFISDGASVPRLPLVYLAVGGRASGPAWVHDFLYQHGRIAHPTFTQYVDRAMADRVFWEAMGVQQPALGFEAESLMVRATMWAGVRAGGWVAWGRKQGRAAALNPVWTSEGWPAEAP